MKKVCFITGTRAEYGLLKPVMDAMREEVSLQLIVLGNHMAKEYGETYREIEEDGYLPDFKLDTLSSEDSAVGMVQTMGNTMLALTEALLRLNPDMVVLLGDRYEIFAAAATAYTLGISVAHISGGELTEGALDDGFRHAITKLSRLHFTANEGYRQRVIQLGEQPDTVFAVGDLGVENAVSLPKIPRKELASRLDFPLEQDFLLFTYHPATLGEEGEEALEEILQAFDAIRMPIVMTKANADAGGKKINVRLARYCQSHPNAKLFDSLGKEKYLSVLSYAKAMVGNSSSGLTEAPALKIPTVNIGDRQNGRMKPGSVLDVPAKSKAIQAAIQKILQEDREKEIENPYEEQGHVSERIKEILLDYLNNRDKQPKRFYDIRGKE